MSSETAHPHCTTDVMWIRSIHMGGAFFLIDTIDYRLVYKSVPRPSSSLIMSLSVNLVVVFSVTVFSVAAASIEISTSPETTANVEKVLPLKEGLENYTIVCSVTNGGSQQRTEWYIERPNINSPFAHIGILINTGLVDYPSDLVDQVIISGPTYTNRFLIKNLTRSFHMAKLQCGTFTTRRKFILRISGKSVGHSLSLTIFIR